MDATNQIEPALTPPTPWPAPPPPPTAHTIFFGRFGFRAGWGFAIFSAFAVFLQVASSLIAVAVTGQLKEAFRMSIYARTHPGAPTFQPSFVPLLVIVADGIIFLGLLGVCWFFSRAERRPFRSYGIGRYRLSDILPGAFWGLVMMGLLVAVLRQFHFLVFDSQALHGSAILLYGLKWLFAFLLVGFAEEYTFRGYVQFTLMRGVWGLAEKLSPANPRPTAFWIAATLLSLLFVLAHTGNGGETFFGLVQIFFAGITFAYALWRTGSLWWGIGFHATWDWAQSFLFGVPDSGHVSVGRLFITHPQGRSILSGGPDGPEGSIFATIALFVTIVIIHFLARPGVQPAIEQEPRPTELPAPSPYAA
jgi:membrane protease YdiL (CAAX protease family)